MRKSGVDCETSNNADHCRTLPNNQPRKLGSPVPFSADLCDSIKRTCFNIIYFLSSIDSKVRLCLGEIKSMLLRTTGTGLGTYYT